MDLQKADIVISHSKNFPNEIVEGFKSIVKSKEMNFMQEERDDNIYGMSEWFLPTALILYVSKPFFESFPKEAGKDSYVFLKKGILYLAKVILGKNKKVNIIRIAIPSGKFTNDPLVSSNFSIMIKST